MKLFLCTAVLMFLSVAVSAQRIETEAELFGKISNLTKTGKAADQDKAYQLSKVFLAKFGKNNDAEVKKVREFSDNYEKAAISKRIEEGKIAEAFTFGKEALANNPENVYVLSTLAYAGLKAAQEKKDKSFAQDSVQYARQTLELFAGGRLPKPLPLDLNETEVTAFMYYVVGYFSIDSDLKNAAANLYKAVQFESKIKNTSYPYAVVAIYYEKEFEAAGKAFDAKYPPGTRETVEMKAENARIEKLMAAMQDAYARAFRLGETEKSPNLNAWKQRFMQIYAFLKNSEAGAEEFLANVLNTPMPDPNAP